MSRDEETLRDVSPSEQRTMAAPARTSGKIELPPAGYQFGDVIGKGGMGEVVAAHDLRIGRDVAVKRMRNPDAAPDAIARFLREARIQARLDHPAIVPVHELGTDVDGRPYFTMKRLAGVTLSDKLYTDGKLPQLLRAFADVCLAVELAHTRGVIHRDLKPANIMLGDYGEVYVLDWGIARVVDEHDPGVPPEQIDTFDEGTQTGAILGTPGYMSPEQVKGIEVTPAVDVYALGAILFEILAGEALHPRGAQAALAMTVTSPQDRPSRRKPNKHIAPELDDACWDALVGDPTKRPRARQLAERVQAYLDGDRDKEGRRALAEQRLAEAKAATDPGQAIYLAGQAVALAPDFTAATEYLLARVVEPPKQDPPELKAVFAEEGVRLSRARNLNGRWAYLSMYLLLIAVPFMNVISWGWLIAFLVIITVFVAQTTIWARNGATNIWIALACAVAFMIIGSRVAGPFMLVPVVLCGMMLAYTTHPLLMGHPWRAAAFAVFTTTLPTILEWVGILAPTYKNGPEGIITVSSVFGMRAGNAELLALFFANAAFIHVVAVFASGINDAAAKAHARNVRQTWALKQLLPH